MDRAEYAAKLSEMDDEALAKEVQTMVWLSAYTNNNPRSKYHWQCDATNDECERRKKPWLFQRGWNNAYSAAGHDPSAHDLEREKPEAWQETAS